MQPGITTCWRKITIHLRCPDSPWYFYFVLATWRGSLLWWEGKKRNFKKSGKAVASLNSLELWVRFSSPKVLPTWTHPRVRFLGVWADFLSWKQRIKRDKVLYYNCSKVCIQHPVKRLLEDLCQLCPSARAPMGCSSPIDLKPFVAFIPHCRANLKLVAQKLCLPFPFDEPSVAMSFQPPQILSKESWMEYIYKARVLYRSVSIPPTTYIFKVGESVPRRWWQLHDPSSTKSQALARAQDRPFYFILFIFLSFSHF
jgi:hypothetical protein